VQSNDAKSSIQDPGSKISVQVIPTTMHSTAKRGTPKRQNKCKKETEQNAKNYPVPGIGLLNNPFRTANINTGLSR
jgi:hypothetical protein